MKYVLMPLDQHFDGGLGATGEAFEEAAETLTQAQKIKGISHAHLPINFLYRHSVELFLKSIIVVVHRALHIRYGDEPDDGPAFVNDNGKWKAITSVHSTAVLYTYVRDVLREQEAELKIRCRTDWQDWPDDFDSAIDTIDKADRTSTFFRYPNERRPEEDQSKSSWKRRDAEALHDQLGGSEKPLKMFLLVDQDDSIEQAFQYDDEPLAELSTLLAYAAKTLSGVHFGLRAELANGY